MMDVMLLNVWIFQTSYCFFLRLSLMLSYSGHVKRWTCLYDTHRNTSSAHTTTRARWICRTVASVSAVGWASASRSVCVVSTYCPMTNAPSNDRRSLKTGHTDDFYLWHWSWSWDQVPVICVEKCWSLQIVWQLYNDCKHDAAVRLLDGTG